MLIKRSRKNQISKHVNPIKTSISTIFIFWLQKLIWFLLLVSFLLGFVFTTLLLFFLSRCFRMKGRTNTECKKKMVLLNLCQVSEETRLSFFGVWIHFRVRDYEKKKIITSKCFISLFPSDTLYFVFVTPLTNVIAKNLSVLR
jgi:hypothetical protein